MPPIDRAGRLSPLGLVLLAVTSVGWGLNFPIMKNLLTEWPPLSSRGLCGIAGHRRWRCLRLREVRN
jgi:probable blue pigment (indigoidine) exporter